MIRAVVLATTLAAASAAQPLEGGLVTPQPGDLAPDPEVESFLDAPALASWDGLAGTAVVMDLWTTWCAPCVATMPHMAALADSFAGRDVQFLSVSDEPLDTVLPFLEGRDLAGWVGIDDDGSSRSAYGVSGIPAVVLVYPDGRLGAVTHPDEVDGAVIEALMAGDSLGVRHRVTGSSIAELIERSRSTRPPVADGPPTFSARWGRMGELGGSRINLNEGWASAEGAGFTSFLVMAWSSTFPHGEDPLDLYTRRRYVDLPDTLGRSAVYLELNEPSLTRDTFGPYVLDRLEESLGLEIGFERRPAVTYALRRAPDRAVTLERDGGDRRASASGSVFSVTGVTSAQLAFHLSNSLGHLVVDETGLEGTYKVLLDLDPGVVDFDPTVMTYESLEGVRAGLLEATGLELVPEVRPVEWMVVRRVREDR